MHSLQAIDDSLTFGVQFTDDTLAVTAPTGTPTYAVYEQTTTTAILTGNMTEMTGTTGFWAATITLSTANGFEIGKSYIVRVTGTVSAVSQGKIAAQFNVLPDIKKLIRYFANESSVDLNTGTITVRNDADSADLYTVTDTVSGSTQTKGAIT